MKIRHIEPEETSVNSDHQALGLPPVEYEIVHATEHPVLKFASYVVMSILLALGPWK